LDEPQDDDDVSARSWRFRWKTLIGKYYRREEGWTQGHVIEDVHLFEDRKLVYAWKMCEGEKGEGEFLQNRKEKKKFEHDKKKKS
jgi:hypothetical protein